jgi:hypothetical protein
MPHRRLFTIAAALTLGVALTPAITTAATAKIPTTCTFTGSGDNHSEAAPSCVAAEITLDRLPAVGESATLRVRLRSQVRVQTARLSVRLPQSLRLDTAGTALSAPRAVGLDQLAEETFALTPLGRTVKLRVVALAPGSAQIGVDVNDAATLAQDRSAHASTVFTVGDRPGRSHAGHDGNDAKAVTAPPARAKTTGHAKPVAQATPAPTRAPALAAGPNQICVNGSFWYTDQFGTWFVGRNVPVYVLGKQTAASATQTFVTGLTSAANGTYSLCFTPPVNQLASLWVQFSTDATLWRVTGQDGSTPYTVTTASHSNVNVGTDQAYGSSSPSALHMRAWHAYDTLNLLWSWRSSSTACWTAWENANCSKLTVRWWPGSTEGPTYTPGPNWQGSYIKLPDDAPNSEHLVLHEAGHAMQHMLYNYWWPASDCPSPHYLHKLSGYMCAWTEGFANAVAGHVKGDGMFVWPNGASVNLMQTNWNDPNQASSNTNPEDGETVELRVAGSLIGLWWYIDGGQAKTLENMRLYRSNSFREWFTDDRPLTAGLVNTSQAQNLVYTHTIDVRTVVNGGFEKGTANWAVTGGVIGNWASYPAQQGYWYAWMGGNGVTSTDTLSQEIKVPAGVTSATLGYYLQIRTWETQAVAYDTLQIKIIDGAITTTLATWSNVNTSNGYVYRTLNLNQWRGRTVWLQFVSQEDSSLQTDFVLDTLAVTTT